LKDETVRFDIAYSPGPTRALDAAMVTFLRDNAFVGYIACAACTAPQHSPRTTTQGVAPAGAVVWSYEVTAEADLDLDVDATFAGRLASDLFVDEEAERFVEGLALFEDGVFRAIEGQGGHLQEACRSSCRVRYRFRLRDAALALADVDVALLAGDALFAPPSTWLLHAKGALAGDRYRLHVSVPPGARFVTGLHPVPGAPDTYEAGAGTFGESTFAAFGALRTPRIAGSAVELAVAPGVPLSDDSIVRWIGSDVRAITRYMGRFPVDRAVMFLAPGTSEATRGKTLGGGGASVLLRTGTRVTEALLAEDWVAAHELVHVGSPSLAGGHAWFSEGLASYVEPIARVRAGLLSPERVWKDLMDGLPQGLPQPGDQGLETDGSWGRVYWGGALYFLLADLGIREGTRNTRSLADAIRAVATTGANVEVTWPIERMLTEGDRATGTRVLHDLYDRLARAPGSENLSALWDRLGVRSGGEGVHFDDGAPLAAFRKAITARAPDREIQTPLP
jgi:hypothetical protein